MHSGDPAKGILKVLPPRVKTGRKTECTPEPLSALGARPAVTDYRGAHPQADQRFNTAELEPILFDMD